MKDTKVLAKKRTTKGSAEAGRLRRTGFFPAVLYSAGRAGQDIQINEHDFVLMLREHHGESLVVDLEIEGEGASKALIKAMQHNPLTGRIMHVDFYGIKMDQKIEIEVPVKIVGDAAGVVQGGVLEHILRTIQVACLPGDMPEELPLDVSKLGLGETLRVRDIQVNAQLDVLTDGDLVVVSIAAPRGAAADDGEEAAGAAEPEVIKAKKEDPEAEKK